MAEPRARGRQGAALRGGSRQAGLDAPRLAALDVLKAVRVDKAYANLVLPAVIRHYELTGRDAAFATELASGTIRLSFFEKLRRHTSLVPSGPAL